MSFELVPGTNRFELEIEGTAFKVEFFILSSDLHDQERFSRRKQVVMDDLPLFVSSVEDLIITKLRWARPKDIEDIEDTPRGLSSRRALFKQMMHNAWYFGLADEHSPSH